MSKKCYKCKKTKKSEEFSKNKSRKDGLSSQCKSCHSKLRRKHYIKNINKINQQVKIQKAEYKEWIKSLKDKPCKDCNIRYPYYVMQFDHIDPKNKLYNVGDMARRTLSKEKVLEEVQKCDLVCANCHAERTNKRNKK